MPGLNDEKRHRKQSQTSEVNEFCSNVRELYQWLFSLSDWLFTTAKQHSLAKNLTVSEMEITAGGR